MDVVVDELSFGLSIVVVEFVVELVGALVEEYIGVVAHIVAVECSMLVVVVVVVGSIGVVVRIVVDIVAVVGTGVGIVAVVGIAFGIGCVADSMMMIARN